MNGGFLPFVIQIHFTDLIFWNPRKIEDTFDDFRRKQNRNPKADNFFELTDSKWMYLKVRSNYLKFLKNFQNFSVNIDFYHIFFANTPFKFGSICSLFRVNDIQKSWTICLILFSFKKSRKLRHFLTE